MSDYGMWSFHIPAFRAAPPPSHSESPPPMTGSANDHGSPIFDARSLAVKQELPPVPSLPVPPASAPFLVGDAGVEVHGGAGGGTTLRRGGGSAFGFVDVCNEVNHHQPPTPVYHPFGGGAVTQSRIWASESMAADEYDASTGLRMTSCGGGGRSVSGSDGGGRAPTSAVSSEDRSPTSPTTRVEHLDSVSDPSITSDSSNILIGKLHSSSFYHNW